MAADIYLMTYQLRADGSMWADAKTYQQAADGSYLVNPSLELVNEVNSDANLSTSLDGAATLYANYVKAGYNSFVNRPQGVFLGLDEVAYLRAAVDKGMVTAAQVLSVFGDIKVSGVTPLTFHLAAPTVISAQDANLYSTAVLGNSLALKDFFTSPVFFIDDSAIAANQSWSVPAGMTMDQFFVNTWANSGNSAIAAIVQADAATLHLGYTDTAWITHPNAHDAQEVYLAYFGRPADLAGIKTTEAQIAAAGGDQAIVAPMFANSPESAVFYQGMDARQKVNTIYNQLFNRDAETAGSDYWVHQLELGLMDQLTMGIKILNGALNSDLATVNNRLVVSQYFTEHVKVAEYVGDTAAANARMLLSSVTSNAADIAKAEAVIDSAAFKADLNAGVVSDDIQLVGLHISQYYHG